MLILGVESSCDETAVALVENGRHVLASVLHSQIQLHQPFGGVVPELASRRHVEAIVPVCRAALAEAQVPLSQVDAVAVTTTPGLVGALLVGVSFAKALADALGKPLLPVRHLDGHIAANLLSHPSLEPPFLCLVVSGGHTSIEAWKADGQRDTLARTHDDAAGEAFDKLARALGFGYPGGPAIDRAAQKGDPERFHFAQPKVRGERYDFSYSGLKTDALQQLKKAGLFEATSREQLEGDRLPQEIRDFCASYQKAIILPLVEHTVALAKEKAFDRVLLSGGVAANGSLRQYLEKACQENGLECYLPDRRWCTDNAAMIAAAAYWNWQKDPQTALRGVDLWRVDAEARDRSRSRS